MSDIETEGYIFGAMYKTHGANLFSTDSNIAKHTVQCAACSVSRSTNIMIPGRTYCPPKYTKVSYTSKLASLLNIHNIM